MIKRIIFDIDGTLITDVDFASSVRTSMKRYGIEDLNKAKEFLINISEYEKQYRYYDKDLYLKFFSEKLSINFDYEFLKIFFAELKNAIPSNSDKIKFMLSSLNEYDLVLLSNYFEESQRNRLTAMGINDFFKEYYGEKIIKPNLQSYILASGKYNPSECLIVGDDKKLDIEVPSQLGFNVLWVNIDGDIRSVEDITPDLIKSLSK